MGSRLFHSRDRPLRVLCCSSGRTSMWRCEGREHVLAARLAWLFAKAHTLTLS